jgi:hypothetical protein
MPLVTITLRIGRSQTEKASIHEAVHTALVEAFKIPPTLSIK